MAGSWLSSKWPAPRARRIGADARVPRRRSRSAGARRSRIAETGRHGARRAASAARHPRRAALHAHLSLGTRQRPARGRSPRSGSPPSSRTLAHIPDSSSLAAASAASAFPTASRTRAPRPDRSPHGSHRPLSSPLAFALAAALRLAAPAPQRRGRRPRSIPPERQPPAAADQGGGHRSAGGVRRGRPLPARDGGVERRHARARDWRRQRLLGDLDRSRPAPDRRHADDHRVRPGAREGGDREHPRAGLSDIVTVVSGDAFKQIPKLPASSTSCSSMRGSATTRRFFDLVFPRLRPRGLFLAHNVVNKRAR